MIILFYLVPIAVAATIGIGIWRSGAARTSEETRTLRFLGLNLIEPGINVFVVTGIIVLFKPHFVEQAFFSAVPPPPLWTYFGLALALTLPMAVLLVPGLGWNSADWECRRINRGLAAIGLLRWGVGALTFIWQPALMAGITIFVGSVWWVNQQARLFTDRGPAHVLLGEPGEPDCGPRDERDQRSRVER